MNDENVLRVYADGSSRNKPRRGGVGIRFAYFDTSKNEVKEDIICPGYMNATNNEMELQACIIGLCNAPPYLKLKHFSGIVILTDSSYVVDNYRNAMFLWPKTKWQKKDGGPVLNAELWKELTKGIKKLRVRVEIRKVKGHSRDIDNKAVDKLAKESAMNPLYKPLSTRIPRRKITKEKTEIGSVEMLGQRMMIRIVEGQYLRTQHIYRYRYEVMSKKSPYYQKVDFICSTVPLHETNTYSIRCNTKKGSPFITKVFKEIPKAKKG